MQILVFTLSSLGLLMPGARGSAERAPADSLDLVILNGRVVDGTGKPGYRADVGIRNGRIVRVGSVAGEAAKQTINAQGLVVAPGFIDVHTHLEEQIQKATQRFPAQNFVLQGVTTVITGNCGRSVRDPAAFFRKLERLKLAINIGTLVGHNTVRQLVTGWKASKPTRRQLRRMQSLVEAALESGAVGFSTGLCYRPGLFAGEDEVVALVSVAASRGAVYATHIRDEGAGGMAALEEAVRTAQRAGAPKLHIAHFKAAGRSQWGSALERLAWLRSAAGAGTALTADLYPYTASSSTLDYLIPAEAFRALGGPAARRAKDFKRAIDLTLEKLRRDGWQDYAHVRVAFSARHKHWIGRTIPDIVADRGASSAPSARDQAAWVLRNQARGDVQIISEEMSERDVRQIITAPEIAFGSDSSVRQWGLGRPHPRAWGTYPRVFAECVRNLKLMTLEEAVRRATGLPAAIFDLPERGLVREGYWADLVLFDPARIQDRATAEDPWQPPEGIPFVIENGVVIVRDGRLTGMFPGRPVRRQF